jgi:hypothetical protein
MLTLTKNTLCWSLWKKSCTNVMSFFCMQIVHMGFFWSVQIVFFWRANNQLPIYTSK